MTRGGASSAKRERDCQSACLGRLFGRRHLGGWRADNYAPLPKDLAITPPGPDIPSEIARFSGVWIAEWNLVGQRSGAELNLDTALVVTKIEPNAKGGFDAQVMQLGTFSGELADWPRQVDTRRRRDRFGRVATNRLDGTKLSGTFTQANGWKNQGKLSRKGTP